MALTFGVTVLPDPPYTRLIELIQKAEGRGFESGWTYDSHILWQESYATLPLVAAATEKIKLGHCVTNPGIRDPTVTASWYATMQDISNGRMVMGIGRGDSSRRVVGLKPVRVAEFEARLRMIKDLMNGRKVEWNEKELQLEWVRDEPHLRRRRRRARTGALVPGDGLEPRHGPDRALWGRLRRDPLGPHRFRQGAEVLRLQGAQPGWREARRVRDGRDLRPLLRTR